MIIDIHDDRSGAVMSDVLLSVGKGECYWFRKGDEWNVMFTSKVTRDDVAGRSRVE